MQTPTGGDAEIYRIRGGLPSWCVEHHDEPPTAYSEAVFAAVVAAASSTMRGGPDLGGRVPDARNGEGLPGTKDRSTLQPCQGSFG